MRSLRVLFVAPYVPSRLRTRPFHFIRGLAARGHRVTLLAVATTAGEMDDAAALRQWCEGLDIVRLPLTRSLWSCAGALARRQPLQAAYCVSPAMTTRIHAALASRPPFDVLHIEHLRAAPYGLAAPMRPRVYDAIDCMSRLLARTAAEGPTWASRTTARMEMAATRRFERAVVDEFDRVLISSETDRRALLDVAGRRNGTGVGHVRTLTNGVDLAYFAPGDARRDAATLVFVGRMAYHANRAAAQALIETILPRIWARRPEVRVSIVGADPPPALRALAARAGERVAVTGTVPDVRPFLARASVSVNPLPYAVGIQNKVLEAMAMATPVVASPAAAAGLAAAPGVDLLVEADPDGFAAAVLRLLDDSVAAARIGAAGRRYVCEQHDWPRVVADLEAVYGELAGHAAAEGEGGGRS